MAKITIQFDPKPQWDHHPLDSQDTRERREDLEEWEEDCRKRLRSAFDLAIHRREEIDWDCVPEEFRFMEREYKAKAEAAAKEPGPPKGQQFFDFDA